jgi:hypothetical protein
MHSILFLVYQPEHNFRYDNNVLIGAERGLLNNCGIQRELNGEKDVLFCPTGDKVSDRTGNRIFHPDCGHGIGFAFFGNGGLAPRG